MHLQTAYFCNAFLKFMKENNLCCLIFGILILICPLLTIALQTSDSIMIKVESVSVITQDYSLSHDLQVLDLNSGSSEVQIRILREEITFPVKTVTSSKFLKVHFFLKKVQNKIFTPVSKELIATYRCSGLFTGVFLI